MTGVAGASRRPPRPEGGVGGRGEGGVFARGGRRVLGVGGKRPGRHRGSVHRAWCSALCTAGLSHCCCPNVLWEKGRAGVGEKGILAGNLVGVCTGREAGAKNRWRNAGDGCGEVLRVGWRGWGGVHCADIFGISLWKKTRSISKERKEGIEGVSVNRKNSV